MLDLVLIYFGLKAFFLRSNPLSLFFGVRSDGLRYLHLDGSFFLDVQIVEGLFLGFVQQQTLLEFLVRLVLLLDLLVYFLAPEVELDLIVRSPEFVLHPFKVPFFQLLFDLLDVFQQIEVLYRVQDAVNFRQEFHKQDQDRLDVFCAQSKQLADQEELEGLSGEDVQAEIGEVNEGFLALEVPVFKKVLVDDPHEILPFFKVRQEHEAVGESL